MRENVIQIGGIILGGLAAYWLALAINREKDPSEYISNEQAARERAGAKGRALLCVAVFFLVWFGFVAIVA